MDNDSIALNKANEALLKALEANDVAKKALTLQEAHEKACEEWRSDIKSYHRENRDDFKEFRHNLKSLEWKMAIGIGLLVAAEKFLL